MVRSNINTLFWLQPVQPGQATVLPPLRGIAHTNLVNKIEYGCDDPDVKVIEGGINGAFAKIEVCSKESCPLNSMLYLYTRN